jgi:hypothetical protein
MHGGTKKIHEKPQPGYQNFSRRTESDFLKAGKKLNNIQREIQGYSKRSIHFKKVILQKLLTLNPCPVYGRKGNLSNF